MAAPTIEQAFQPAIGHHQAGRLAEAEAIYRQILAVQPQYPNALHFIGLLAFQAGKNDMALELIAKSIEAVPTHSQFHSNFGEVYRTVGRLDDSLASLRRGLALNASSAEVHNNLGNTLRDLGRPEEASACFQCAIRSDTSGKSASYTHDFNGNRKKRIVGGVEDIYTYDFENRMTGLAKNTPDGTGSYQYAYDYRTRRVSRSEQAAGAVRCNGFLDQHLFSGWS